MNSPWIEPLQMAGGQAQLLPLAPEHEPALCDAVRDGELWKLWYTAVPSPDGMKAEIDRRLKLQAQGLMLARRTVAKYREQLGIPVARLRKTL